MNRRKSTKRHVVTLLCVLAGSALSGCETPPAGPADYRTKYPIAAQVKVFSLILPAFASGRKSTATDLHRIRLFAADYLRRGRGPFLVSQDKGAADFRENGAKFADVLVEAGVPRHMIFFQVRSAKNRSSGNRMELSYTGYVVRVPRCGDWSGHAGFDPSNRVHTDFGCSYQRNTGLMLSNPGDLSVAGSSVDGDTPNSDRVVGTYRGGKRLGRDAPTLEQKDITEVIKQ